jgi:hypothetical protein
MKDRSHDHGHHGGHGHQHGHAKRAAARGLHRDWRFWVAVALMLAAMVAYVLSMDESLVPGGNGQEQPAAIEGADGI